MMVSIGRRITLMVVLAGGIILGGGSRAHAGLTLTLSEAGFGTLTITDNMVGDLDPSSDSIIFSGTYGDFQLNKITVTSNSPGGFFVGANGPDDGGLLQNVTIDTRNNVAGTKTLTLGVVSTGFTSPGTAGSQLQLDSSLASSLISKGGSGTFTSSLDTTSSSTVTLSTPNGLAVSPSLAVIRVGSSYILSNQLTVTLGALGTAQFTGTTTAVLPEPGTVAMTLAALPVLGFSLWRRRAKA